MVKWRGVWNWGEGEWNQSQSRVKQFFVCFWKELSTSFSLPSARVQVFSVFVGAKIYSTPLFFHYFSRQLMLSKVNSRTKPTGITVIIASRINSKIMAVKLQVRSPQKNLMNINSIYLKLYSQMNILKVFCFLLLWWRRGREKCKAEASILWFEISWEGALIGLDELLEFRALKFNN